MRTTVTELPESRAKLEVGIEAHVVAKRIERAAKQLAGEMKIPGFRKGKVPPQLVIQRIGREAVVEQAIRESVPEWYEQAIIDSGLATVGDPNLDIADLPEEGEDLVFTVEVGVRPTAELGEYRGLEVAKPELEIPEADVERELDRLRDAFGSLNPVERAAQDGDAVVIDYEGTIDDEPFEGSSGKDFTVELGSEGLLEEFQAALPGKSAGDETRVEVAFPEDHRPEELAGKTATFDVTVKEVREKELPELDDEFAQRASEFDTLDELRGEIRKQMATALEARAESEFRDAAVAAAVEAATVVLPHDLVHARAHELWERFERTLMQQGIDPRAYAQMQGKDRHDLIDEGEESAAESLKREAVLAGVAEAEGIEPTDDELIEALGPGKGKDAPEKILKRLRENGRDVMLREEVRLRKAAQLIAEQARPIPKAQAEAREQIWTPDQTDEDPAGAEDAPAGGADKPGELWTPGR